MALGILYLFLTFLLSFILVHAIHLVILGIKFTRIPRKKEEKPTPKQEPIYYIVEKKRAKKATYSDPKEIRFKD